MFEYKRRDLSKNTVEFLVTISQTTLKIEYQKSFEKLRQQLQVEGFRKGKVPKTIAEKHLPKESIFQEVVKDLLPKIYHEIVTKENLQPIINPKIELIKIKESEDWQIKITVAGKPILKLTDYKKVINQTKAQIAKENIWIPGKDKEVKDKEKEKQNLLNKILDALLKESKFEISDLVIEEELNHRLSQLLDDIKKIGLTVDGYLRSKNLTMDELKKHYRQEIYDTYKLEFILQEIADQEGIKVEDKDLKAIFSQLKDEKEKKMAESNAYFYASILRKQKTLDFLLSL